MAKEEFPFFTNFNKRKVKVKNHLLGIGRVVKMAYPGFPDTLKSFKSFDIFSKIRKKFTFFRDNQIIFVFFNFGIFRIFCDFDKINKNFQIVKNFYQFGFLFSIFRFSRILFLNFHVYLKLYNSGYRLCKKKL